MRVLVAGAGGFIGGHLVRRLLKDGHEVRAVDIKPKAEWQQWPYEVACGVGWDLRDPYHCQQAVRAMDWVFNLASDMGGMGFIANNKAACMISVLINTNLLLAAKEANVERYFFSSSACIYPTTLQGERQKDSPELSEDDAYPAMPEDGYGWEKLFSERMCHHFTEDYGLDTRVARYHNVYGPHGTFDGGREKAPAAICRKVAQAVINDTHEIEVWGDGEQTRSFMYIDDCIDGTLKLMNSDYPDPLNIGSAELVSINQLVTLVEAIAGVSLQRYYNPTAPQGVRGRNSDNTLCRETLGWEPSCPLIEGLHNTYNWIYKELKNARI